MSDEDRTATAYDSMVKQFGESVMKGDWSAAYAMTTPEFQKTTSQADMQKQYEDVVNQIKQAEPDFKPNMVQVEHGELPSDEKDASETYHFKTIPPKSTWKGWMFSEIGVGDKDGMDHGLEAGVFVVELDGQPKLAHVEFELQD